MYYNTNIKLGIKTDKSVDIPEIKGAMLSATNGSRWT